MTIWQADVSPKCPSPNFFLKDNRSTSYYVIEALRGGRELLAELYAMTNELDVLLNNSLLCYAPVLFCSFFDGCL